MATKTQPKRKGQNARPLGRCALYAEEVYWIGLAAKALGLTVHEFLSRRIRQQVRNELIGRGIDPDRSWANVEGD